MCMCMLDCLQNRKDHPNTPLPTETDLPLLPSPPHPVQGEARRLETCWRELVADTISQWSLVRWAPPTVSTVARVRVAPSVTGAAPDGTIEAKRRIHPQIVKNPSILGT